MLTANNSTTLPPRAQSATLTALVDACQSSAPARAAFDCRDVFGQEFSATRLTALYTGTRTRVIFADWLKLFVETDPETTPTDYIGCDWQALARLVMFQANREEEQMHQQDTPPKQGVTDDVEDSEYRLANLIVCGQDDQPPFMMCAACKTVMPSRFTQANNFAGVACPNCQRSYTRAEVVTCMGDALARLVDESRDYLAMFYEFDLTQEE